MSPSFEMVEVFKAELKLCKVGPGEVLAVLSAGTVRADYAQAFLVAAAELGATAFQINVRADERSGGRVLAGASPVGGCRPVVDALKAADIVIDLMGLLFSTEQLEITSSGTRMLMVIEPFAVLRKLLPGTDIKRRVKAASAALGAAREMRITSPAGTDIRYGLQQYPVLEEYGYVDEPGRWDHWPSGFLLTQGNDKQVDGRVVLSPGDILTAFRRYVESPVTFTVEAGMVTRIEGAGLDAAMLRSYMDSYQDPRAYAVSHIGWGMNESAHWHHLGVSTERYQEIGVNGLAFYGNVLFSLGPNTEVGGSNDTQCHIDIPMRGCSLYLDDTLIVDGGIIVPQDMRAPGR